MSFFSKLFGKKDTSLNTKYEIKSEKSNVITHSNPQISEEDIPPYQGEYAKAIFLNAYSKASPIKKPNEYQGYLLYECGIRNAEKFHREMISVGYLFESTKQDTVVIIPSSNRFVNIWYNLIEWCNLKRE